MEAKRRLKRKELRFKVVIVGTYGVGKTSILLQHFDRYFTRDPKTTVGVDFRQRKFHVNNASVILEVWDTAGEEKYANIVQIYYRGAHAVIAVYDIMKRTSYVRALEYIAEITGQAVPPLVIALVGNKRDLCQDGRREVATETAATFAAARNLVFMETSAKSTDNVDELFESVSERLVDECEKRKTDTHLRQKLRLNSSPTTATTPTPPGHRVRCCHTS
ncbi:unnamed protein product [Medioppia subpectinata]|uniref:Uncharacterized protein n=1 Tax=Medioppia subpectinata TaxID=1979941 RepID=A0A7R9KXP8_9ACAR|nr:unnamed protein product [Medioppia subpectinata]CAG2110658.1 unnamed protein product [Medioppia subpectinata]